MGPRDSWLALALGTVVLGLELIDVAGPPVRWETMPADAPPPAVQPAEVRWAGEAEWPDDHRGSFLAEATPLAIASGLSRCVPPSVTLAQAILESGWGRSTLARRHHNWFGIKGAGVVLETIEGVGEPARASFRRWESPVDGVTAHARILSADRRYSHAWATWPDGRRFARAIAGTWATDPRYAERLVWLIDRYRLDRWDAQVAEASPCGDATASTDSHAD
ncbi:MAG: flagellum-specific peptidoglycan hydrolase FlgJ [Myxococcota bacterium]|jgi:flagellum-specific peptidoglycan hydrolase FlgJ